MGEIRNSIGNGEAKEFICMTHGYELRRKECWREWGYVWRVIKGRRKNGTTVII